MSKFESDFSLKLEYGKEGAENVEWQKSWHTLLCGFENKAFWQFPQKFTLNFLEKVFKILKWFPRWNMQGGGKQTK